MIISRSQEVDLTLWRFVFSPLWLRRAVSADVLVVHAALPSCDVQFVDKVSVLVSVGLDRCITSLWASFGPLFFTAAGHWGSQHPCTAL